MFAERERPTPDGEDHKDPPSFTDAPLKDFRQMVASHRARGCINVNETAKQLEAPGPAPYTPSFLRLLLASAQARIFFLSQSGDLASGQNSRGAWNS